MRRCLNPKPHTPYPASSRRGQSIVEAMIAITVLTTGFLGISTLLARSYFLDRVVSDQVTANYLAAEGIEIAKNLIDHDVIESSSGNPTFAWGTCFAFPHNDVELDYTTANCGNMQPFANDFLLFDPVTHLYSYGPPLGDNPVTTHFTRRIQVVRNGCMITVDTTVQWNTATVVGQSLKLEDTFYDWRQPEEDCEV